MATNERYVSDHSQLTVSKPSPLNARQEAFARNIAEGRSQREAYQCAGYTPASDSVADVNASAPPLKVLRGAFPRSPQPGAQPRPGGRRSRHAASCAARSFGSPRASVPQGPGNAVDDTDTHAE